MGPLSRDRRGAGFERNLENHEATGPRNKETDSEVELEKQVKSSGSVGKSQLSSVLLNNC